MSKIPILRVRDKDGNVIPVPAIVGESAYQIAVKYGFEGTEEEWINSIRNGDSAYELAVKHGFEGSEEEWVATLTGKSAYAADKEGGYSGTEAEFASDLASLRGLSDWLSNY